MKKSILISVVFCLVLVFTASFSFASVEKLKTGFTDIIYSPMEIVDHTTAEFKEATFKPFGLVGGLIKGTFYMGKKIVGGVVDVVTFPVE